MDRIEEILESEIAHLRKMIAMMDTGGVTMRSHKGDDITREIADDHRVREAELNAALGRHKLRTK